MKMGMKISSNLSLSLSQPAGPPPSERIYAVTYNVTFLHFIYNASDQGDFFLNIYLMHTMNVHHCVFVCMCVRMLVGAG